MFLSVVVPRSKSPLSQHPYHTSGNQAGSSGRPGNSRETSGKEARPTDVSSGSSYGEGDRFREIPGVFRSHTERLKDCF